jgi:hypothetical protein
LRREGLHFLFTALNGHHTCGDLCCCDLSACAFASR